MVIPPYQQLVIFMQLQDDCFCNILHYHDHLEAQSWLKHACASYVRGMYEKRD